MKNKSFIRRKRRPKIGKYFLRITRNEGKKSLHLITWFYGVPVIDLLLKSSCARIDDLICYHPNDLYSKEDKMPASIITNRYAFIKPEMLKYFFGPANYTVSKSMLLPADMEDVAIWPLVMDESQFAISYNKKMGDISLLYFHDIDELSREQIFYAPTYSDKERIQQRTESLSKNREAVQICENFFRELLNMIDYYYEIQNKKYTLKVNYQKKKNRYAQKDLPWQ